MTDPESVRAFLAVPPDPGWVESARGLVARLRPGSPHASWTRPESWHLTLRFLGAVSREWLAGFAAAISRITEGRPGFDLSTAGAVRFPPRGPARVLGIGFETESTAGTLSALAREAERAASSLGLEPERRPYDPHVTLARLRRPWSAEAIAHFTEEANRWAFPPWPVRSCVLFESRLTSGGAVHTPAARWALAPQEVSA